MSAPLASPLAGRSRAPGASGPDESPRLVLDAAHPCSNDYDYVGAEPCSRIDLDGRAARKALCGAAAAFSAQRLLSDLGSLRTAIGALNGEILSAYAQGGLRGVARDLQVKGRHVSSAQRSVRISRRLSAVPTKAARLIGAPLMAGASLGHYVCTAVPRLRRATEAARLPA